jgi:hypothetical protein
MDFRYNPTALTPAQGRVLYHQERLFRSTGGSGILAHQRYLRLCAKAGLHPDVGAYSRLQCIRALQLIERAARDAHLHLFRNVTTQWGTL